MVSVSVRSSHPFSPCELLWFAIQAFNKLFLDLDVEL